MTVHIVQPARVVVEAHHQGALIIKKVLGQQLLKRFMDALIVMQLTIVQMQMYQMGVVDLKG